MVQKDSTTEPVLVTTIETEIESLKKIGKAEIKHTEAHVLNNLDEVLYENPRRYDDIDGGKFYKITEEPY